MDRNDRQMCKITHRSAKRLLRKCDKFRPLTAAPCIINVVVPQAANHKIEHVFSKW